MAAETFTASFKKCCNLRGQWTVDESGPKTDAPVQPNQKGRQAGRPLFIKFDETLVVAASIHADLHPYHVLDGDVRVVGLRLADKVCVDVKDAELHDLFRRQI